MRSRGTRLAKEDSMTINGAILLQIVMVTNFSVTGVPQAIVTDHGLHFRNHMMIKLIAKLGLSHDSSTPYYPQANG